MEPGSFLASDCGPVTEQDAWSRIVSPEIGMFRCPRFLKLWLVGHLGIGSCMDLQFGFKHCHIGVACLVTGY